MSDNTTTNDLAVVATDNQSGANDQLLSSSPTPSTDVSDANGDASGDTSDGTTASVSVSSGSSATAASGGSNAAVVPSGSNTTVVPAGNNAPVVPAGINTTVVPAGNNAPVVPAGINAPVVPAGINAAVVPTVGHHTFTIPNFPPQPYPNVIPYNGTNGTIYTQDTPYTQFTDWISYTTFCLEGPKIRILCANAFNNQGHPISYFSGTVSKKLLCDFGQYFAAMMRGPWTEANTGFVQFDDILMEDFMRLHLVLMAGAPASRVNIGRSHETVSNLLETYILADRFQMPVVKTWIQGSMEEYLRQNFNWATVYHHQVMEQPAVPGAEDIHKQKIMDFNNAYMRMMDLLPEMRPIAPHAMRTFVMTYCPRQLLISVLPDLDHDFLSEIFETFLKM